MREHGNTAIGLLYDGVCVVSRQSRDWGNGEKGARGRGRKRRKRLEGGGKGTDCGYVGVFITGKAIYVNCVRSDPRCAICQSSDLEARYD